MKNQTHQANPKCQFKTPIEAPDAQSTMAHVLALIESGHNTDGTMFDLDVDEEEYYNECNKAFDNEIVGTVVAQTEPSYRDDDYESIDYKVKIFKPIYEMWCSGGPMPHKKAELEGIFFTASNFPGNISGSNPESGNVHAVVSREMKRRLTLNVLTNESKESLEVVVQRVGELLDKEQSHTELVLEIFVKMNIKSNHDLYITLNNKRDSPQ